MIMEIAVFNLGLVMEIVMIKMILPHVGTLMEIIVVQKRTQWEMKVVILTIVNNAICHYDKGDCCDDSMIRNGKCDAQGPRNELFSGEARKISPFIYPRC